jgi:hypothetical protein
LSLFASSALAGAAGLNLSWDDCGAAGTSQKNFACASNSGANIMFASAVVGVPVPQLNGHEGVIDLQTNEATLSDWWKIGGTGAAPNCRPATTITSNFDFVGGPFSCLDPWTGSAAGGVNFTQAFNGPNRARIRTVCAIPGSTAITGTDEYYVYKVTMTNVRSTGTGSCAGCADGACIVLNSIDFTQPAGVGNFKITNPLVQRHVLWQAGGSAIGGLGCPAQVPTRNQTWGSVKSLYR